MHQKVMMHKENEIFIEGGSVAHLSWKSLKFFKSAGLYGGPLALSSARVHMDWSCVDHWKDRLGSWLCFETSSSFSPNCSCAVFLKCRCQRLGKDLPLKPFGQYSANGPRICYRLVGLRGWWLHLFCQWSSIDWLSPANYVPKEPKDIMGKGELNAARIIL